MIVRMSIFALLAVLFLASGCNTVDRVRNTFFGDEKVSSSEKREYLEGLDELEKRTESFRMYHWLAVGMLAASFFFFVTKQYVLGATSIVGGFVVSGWAMYAPTNERFVGWFLGAMLVLLVLFAASRIRVTLKRRKAVRNGS